MSDKLNEMSCHFIGSKLLKCLSNFTASVAILVALTKLGNVLSYFGVNGQVCYNKFVDGFYS